MNHPLTSSSFWRCSAALLLAWAVPLPGLAQTPDAQCPLPAAKRLRPLSTAVYKCGHRIASDPNCNKIPVTVSVSGGKCEAVLPYGKLEVYTNGSARKVTWVLSDHTGDFEFSNGKGIDIANPGSVYGSPGRDGRVWKFKWQTNGKATPAGGLAHCPVVYHKDIVDPCDAPDPIIVNIE